MDIINPFPGLFRYDNAIHDPDDDNIIIFYNCFLSIMGNEFHSEIIRYNKTTHGMESATFHNEFKK
jgi:hypothetical protein